MKKQRKAKASLSRRSIRIISWLLFTLGVNVSKTDKFLGETGRLIVATFSPFTVSIGTSMYAYINRREFDETVKIAAFLSNCLTVLITLICLSFNKTKIKALIKRLDENVYRYPDEQDIEVKFEGIFKDENSPKITIMVFYYACFGFALSALSPFIGFLINGVYVTSMYPSWFPWSQEGPLLKTLTCVFQGFVSFGAFWNSYALELFLIFLVVEFLKQYKRLCIALSTLDSRTNKILLSQSQCGKINIATMDGITPIDEINSKFKNESYTDIYNKVYRQKIIHCIKHHQEIHRLFKLFRPWFLVFFSTELFFSSITFALVFYNILNLSSGSADASFFLTIIGSSVNVLALLFCRCFVGEMFFEMNNGVLNAIFYEINWKEQSKSNKQLLMLFHLFAKRAHSLTAFSIFPASYYTFAGITRSSYSYFNLLKSSLGKDGRLV